MKAIKRFIPIVLIITLSLNSCTNHKLASKYISTCSYMGEYVPMLKLVLSKDSFIYIDYMNDSIYGNWSRIKDTIILNSSYFFADTSEGPAPNYQYNDIYGVDKFLVRKNRLLSITKKGKTKNCFLIEQSKWRAYMDKQFGR